MAKAVTTVLLNELQIATLEDLRERANNGIVNKKVANTYKQNVLNALLRRGVLRLIAGDHYRIVANVAVELKPETVPRAAKIEAEAEAA
jgi:hypothetical protein